MFNLILITGKLGKISSGLISLKEKNNSQGLFDMGISPESYVSGKSLNDEKFLEQVKKVWGVNELSDKINNVFELMNNGKVKNLFIFGEDPVGCSDKKDDISGLINKSEFKVVQDYFLTETAQLADVVLPASYPFESGGSYTNTQKYIVTFDKEYDTKLEKRSFSQLIELMSKFGVKNKFDLTHNITLEIASLLKDSVVQSNGVGYKLTVTNEDSKDKMFKYGCDYLSKRFEEYFAKQIQESKEIIEN
jgi:formate dehydrogenase major subunit